MEKEGHSFIPPTPIKEDTSVSVSTAHMISCRSHVVHVCSIHAYMYMYMYTYMYMRLLCAIEVVTDYFSKLLRLLELSIFLSH